MLTKEELRQILQRKLNDTIHRVNEALRGRNLKTLKPVLGRIGRGAAIPHWFEGLKRAGTLPNMDGKTVGSVVEMLLVAVMETFTFAGEKVPPLQINPARGVDLPDLDLGVKSPSENFCTSEPFFSAYERLLGCDHDILVLLTDYQTAKSKPPIRLKIIKWRYLNKTQVADVSLCRIARKHREWLVQENEAWAQKIVRFLCFINQSDWRAKRLLALVDAMQDEPTATELIRRADGDLESQNRRRVFKNGIPLPESDLNAIRRILSVTPLGLGIIDAADNWVVEAQKEAARLPNDNEWGRFLTSPLNGQIGMSYALQWRYNFGRLFGETGEKEEC